LQEGFVASNLRAVVCLFVVGNCVLQSGISHKIPALQQIHVLQPFFGWLQIGSQKAILQI
jgi:hypothetical protein